MKRSPVSESATQQAIVDFLALYPQRVLVWRCNAGLARAMFGRGIVRLAPKGAPDLVGLILDDAGVGRFLGIEVKRKGELPRVEQVVFGQWIHRLGGIWFIARSVEDVQREFRAEGLSLAPPRVRAAR